jgi:uncharacterized protein (TIGR02757 family)
LEFIEDDPIQIPHRYSTLQDIEISGFFAATLAWGQRKTIISKCLELMQLMDNSPFEFVKHHSDQDLKSLQHFKHRTFQYTDLLYFIHFFKTYYSDHESLETLFLPGQEAGNIRFGIERFHDRFIDDAYFPKRTGKHVASPARKSACKRINMYLRWLIRKDKNGVDFGLWKNIRMDQLICPCDVHVEKTARKLGLITRQQVDWQMAEELTSALKKFDPFDPVKYDFALFGMGLSAKK